MTPNPWITADVTDYYSDRYEEFLNDANPKHVIHIGYSPVVTSLLYEVPRITIINEMTTAQDLGLAGRWCLNPVADCKDGWITLHGGNPYLDVTDGMALVTPECVGTICVSIKHRNPTRLQDLLRELA